MAGGATAAECVVREGDEFSTLVRLGQVETLKEPARAPSACACFWPAFRQHLLSDFSRDALDRMLKSALETWPRLLPKIRSAAFLKPPNSALSRAISISTSRTCIRSRRRANRLCTPGRESRARLRPAHQKFRRRLIRRRHRSQSVGQLAWLCRRVPPVLLLGRGSSHRASGNRGMQRDYWFSVARKLGRLEFPRK